MADKVLEMEVKSNIKQVAKEQKEWNKEIKKTKENIEDVNEEGKEVVAEMQILGLSINGLKGAWTSAAAGAKFMFRSIKMGLISTGIGAFIVALGSVFTFIAKTKQGAEAFEVVMSALGATFNVIIDRVAKFGGGLAKLFSGNMMGGLRDMKDSFKDIGTEILADTVLTAALIKMQQTLRDSQRDLNVETAQQRAEIERLKLIAEDVTKSTKVRLEAAKEAFAIENRLLNDRIANAKEDLRLQQESMRMTAINKKNTEEELDREAELKINLANITGESLTKQIELNNKINAITAEAAAKAAEALQAQKDAREELLQEDLEFYQNLSAVQKAQREKELEEDHQFYQNLSKMIKEASDKEIAEANRVAAAKEQITKSKRQMDIDIANQSLALISIAAGEGTAISKAAAIAQATIAGHQSVINAFNSANANVGATAGTFGAYPVTMAALAAAFAASNIAKIASTSTSGGSSGVFSSTSGTTVAPQSPAPQMMSGAFDLSGGMQPDPVKAFVVTDEMTNSQNQLANIRRRSTI